MIPCPKCQNPNADDAKTCISCGTVLSVVKNDQTLVNTNRSLMLLVIILAWELLMNINYIILNKVIVPLIDKGGDYSVYGTIDVIYKLIGWFDGLVSLTLGIVFLVMARHKAAKAILIVFVVVQALSLILYKIIPLFNTPSPFIHFNF
jgi:hypothetical protein